MLRQRMSATLIVFMRSFMRHLDTTSSDVPGGSRPRSALSWRSSHMNMG